MILKRVGVFSVVKIMACMYFVFGLIGGAFFSFASIVGASLGNREQRWGGVLFGVLAIVFLPLIYAALGALGGAIMAGLYNLLAHFVGGIELEFEGRKPESWSSPGARS